MNGQNYANHVHRPTAWLVTCLLSVVALVFLAWTAFGARSLQAWAMVILALTVVIAIVLIRSFALRLQNRIIRLEMQVRLGRLACDRGMSRLSIPHLVALRFASDAELPALMDRAIAESFTPDQIKRAVTDWQGDYLRT
jgi:uncharacterized protein DUF6526